MEGRSREVGSIVRCPLYIFTKSAEMRKSAYPSRNGDDQGGRKDRRSPDRNVKGLATEPAEKEVRAFAPPTFLRAS